MYLLLIELITILPCLISDYCEEIITSYVRFKPLRRLKQPVEYDLNRYMLMQLLQSYVLTVKILFH